MQTSEKQIRLYSDVLKKSIKYSLWPTFIPIKYPYYYDSFKEVYSAKVSIRSKPKLFVVVFLSKFLARKKIALVTIAGEIKMEWHPLAHTMVSWERLTNIEDLVIQIHKEGIQGDFLEAGVWRGGSCILMAGLETFLEFESATEKRKIFVADSFEGLPKPDKNNFPDDEGDKLHQESFLSVSLEEVKNNFERYGLLSNQIVFVKGFFKDSLPDAPIKSLALLRVDADMFEGTMQVLELLYDKVSPGGYIIIDDYGAIPNQCGKAVDEFRAKRGIEAPLISVDYTAVYWKKV